MSKALMKSLKTDLPTLAEMIRSKGRGRDTMLAHITPREAALLKRRGGSGSINPDTGLPEFEDSGFYDYSPPADVSPVYDVIQPGGEFQPYTDVGGQQQVAAPAYTPGDVSQYAPAQVSTGDPYANVGGGVAAAPAAAPVAPSFQLPAGYDASTAGFTPAEMAAGSQRAPGSYAEVSPTQLNAARTELGLAPLEGYGDAATADKEKQSYLEKLLSPDGLAKLGVAGLLGAGLTKGVAAPAARQATQQAQQAAQQYQQLAQPYRQTSQNLITSAQTGALTPSNLQAVNTARQIAAQNIRSRGGVGVEQAANQTAQLEANLLEKQFSTGLQLAGIADQYDAQAIQTSLSANQGVVASNAAFYAQLANMLAPFVFGTGQMTSPIQPKTTTTGAV